MAIMKNWSIRTKILVFVELILLVVLGSTTFFHIRQLQKSYITAFEWRSEALAKNIIAKIAEKIADIDAEVSFWLSPVVRESKEITRFDRPVRSLVPFFSRRIYAPEQVL